MISGNGYHGGIVCTEMFWGQEYFNIFILAARSQMLAQTLVGSNSSGQNDLGDAGFLSCGNCLFDQNICNCFLEGCADIRNLKFLFFLVGLVYIVDHSGF